MILGRLHASVDERLNCAVGDETQVIVLFRQFFPPFFEALLSQDLSALPVVFFPFLSDSESIQCDEKE